MDKGALYRDSFRATGVLFITCAYTKTLDGGYDGILPLILGILLFFLPAIALRYGINIFNGRDD